ncbi:acyltransferase [Chitinophaga lutea]|uniref:Acyltransferase n=1 Tax=Chitinophaga lutea TaxID=2488634 RepID=A0A3N4PJG2_9BACT|nr:acyltransferase [Chitinophaga lutea]RPE08366.1 acyltransferase [Chitinophaga lutea]
MHVTPHITATGKGRYDWIDCAKGIAIILVVYRHIAHGLFMSTVELPMWVKDCNDMLYSFRIPLFVALSGVFFSRSLLRYGAGQFVINKMNTLLYPYLLWAIIQISLQISFAEYTNSQRTAADYFNILLQPRALDQLWYLFLLFNVSVLYLCISMLLKGHTKWQLLIGLILLGLAPLVKDYSTFYDIALHYIFFAIGQVSSAWLLNADVQEKLSQGRLLLMLLPVFAALQYYFLLHQDMNLYLFLIVAVFGSLFVTVLSLFLVKHGYLKFLQTIGKYSLYIYLLHVSISSLLRHILYRTGAFGSLTTNTLLLVLLIGLSIYLSIVAYRLLIRLKFGFLFKGSLPERRSANPASNKAD